MSTARVADHTPVIVGVGQWTHHPTDPADSPEPAAMMAETVRRAAADAGPGHRLLKLATGLWTVALTSWVYDDAASTVAETLGISPRHRTNSPIGGEQPQVLISRAARAVSAGEHDVVVITGAEAFRSRRLAKTTGTRLNWTPQPHGKPAGYPRHLLDREPALAAERDAGAAIPLDFYAIFENALRAAAGRGLAEHRTHLGELWHRFAEVAKTNEHAWSQTAPSALEIATPSPSNRMIRYPYTKLLTSNIFVDMSAAVIVTSAAVARAVGVPTDRWVFPLSAAESHEHWFVSERDELHRSVAIAANGRTALDTAGFEPDDISYADVYSCFPSAVQIAAAELGLRSDNSSLPLTVTGGLTFAGGPGNNYVTHAVSALVVALRNDPGAVGLCTANGMFLTKHALALYSTDPPSSSFRWSNVQREVDGLPKRAVALDYRGRAILESYTVTPGVANETPSTATIVGRTPDGRRCWRRTVDEHLVRAMELEEFIGRDITVHDKGIEVD
ncbi:acetyl-CoA acetyltransferase [Mycobacterium kyogaense]|uniref:acetyl-CoA acetyltransferase n=1 Tax=Mycobacterium kyogaense TaxID=2212479 RepID=UPI000DAEA99C|nr:acetyl-CoA acetyltransferase [Mycobacterium kyogaense]